MQIEKIKKSKDFRRISQKSKKLHSRSFLILYSYDLEEELFKYGITVTKKIGGAVIRNRCKRVIRAIIAELRESLPPISIEVVVIVRPAFLEQSFQELKLEFINAFEKIK